MNTTTLIARQSVAALLFCLSITGVYAQSADDPDPPGRAGRLSLVQGDVSLQPAGAQDWANAVVNRPLTTGDRLWSDQDGRAEVQVGQATVRLGSNTGFSFLNVDDDTIQMRLTAGIVNLRVRSLDSNDQMEIDTPNLALSILRPGNYRVEVNDAGDTTVVKVSEGEAEATGGSRDVVVHAQQAVVFRGVERLTADVGSLGAPDAFDSWSLERDRREQAAMSSPSAEYVSPDVTGYEDLDSNGRWASDPDYGYVWTPTVVAADWAPYRYGRWVWVSPWGWTWIDDAPWGYAPFHYGRWAHVRDRWCWVPGPRHVRAVYAPALVGWVGTPDFSVSVSVGGGAGVAWFPLGPREVYVPARRYSPRYVERVNVSNTVIVNRTYITNVYDNRVTNITYRNRTVPGGVTAVSRTTFTSAEPVGRHVVRVDEREITRVRASGAAPRIDPPRQAILGTNDAARRNVRMPPAALRERQVVAKRTPPPAAAQFVRGAGTPASGSEMAERARRMEAERNAAVRRTEGGGRDQVNERDRLNGRDAATARDPTQPARPSRNDRPQRALERDQAQQAQRDQQTQRQFGRDQQVQREQQTQRDLNARREQQERDQAQRQQMQREQQGQRDQQAQREMNARREQQDRDQAQRQQQAQREQQGQREQQMQREMNARREQQDRDQAQRQQQAQREQQGQRDQQAQREMNARREQQDRDQAQRLQQAQREQQGQREQQMQREMSARREQQDRDQAQRQQQVQREQQAQREQAQQQAQRQRTAEAPRPNPQPDAGRGERNDRPQSRRPDQDPRSERGDRSRNPN